MKNIFISMGFGGLSFIGSTVYYLILPYLISWSTFGLQGGSTYLSMLAPAPIVIFVALWLYSTGVYFFNNKLIKASGVLIILSIMVGVTIIIVPHITNNFLQ